jgi:hypothetical protein
LVLLIFVLAQIPENSPTARRFAIADHFSDPARVWAAAGILIRNSKGEMVPLNSEKIIVRKFTARAAQTRFKADSWDGVDDEIRRDESTTDADGRTKNCFG